MAAALPATFSSFATTTTTTSTGCREIGLSFNGATGSNRRHVVNALKANPLLPIASSGIRRRRSFSIHSCSASSSSSSSSSSSPSPPPPSSSSSSSYFPKVPMASTKLFVSGLSFRTTQESLRNAFQNFGQLVEVNLVMDRKANRPRGFAFLRYSTEDDSKKAIEGMHGKFLDGRVIFVEIAKPPSELQQAPNSNTRRYTF